MSKRAQKKPLQVAHGLAIYDGVSEELIEFIQIKYFDLAAFKKQLDVSEATDPGMLDRYAVGPDDAPFVKQALQQELQFDFKTLAYFIEAARVDEA